MTSECKKKWSRLIRLLAVVGVVVFVVVYEATCAAHGGGHIHLDSLISSATHWGVHIAACVLVCEYVHSITRH